jgi:RND family efflux transporter MFP subunit
MSLKNRNMLAVIVVFLVAAGFLSCGRSAPPDSEHDHEEIKLMLSAYKDSIELFAEADPFAVESSSGVLVHLTRLEDFKPVADAKVSAGLFSGKAGSWQPPAESVGAGIYRFKFRPSRTGTARLLFRIEAAGRIVTIQLSGITVHQNHEDAIHEAEENSSLPAGAVPFPKEHSWKVDFATGFPELRQAGPVIQTTAVAGSAPADETIIVAKAPGMVVFASNSIVEGLRVGKGQPLMMISGEGMAENDLSVRFIRARNEFEKAESEYLRLKTLARDRIVSEKALIDARNDFENARATFQGLQKNFNSRGQAVFSTMNGFIRALPVRNGDYVEPGKPLCSIAEHRTFIVRGEIPWKYLPFLNEKISANLKFPGSGKIFTLEELGGRLISFGRSVDPADSMIPVSFEIRSEPGIVPGAILELFIKTVSERKALLVPNGGLIEEQGSFFLWRQVTPELFEKVAVRIGFSDGLFTEIVSGVRVTDRIVTRGAIFVKLSAASSSLDPHSGHTH